MATKITVRFFDVLRFRNQDAPMEQVLSNIGGVGDLRDREADAAGVRARLERLDGIGSNILSGEITRHQTDNFPVSILPDGLEELDVETLGHGVAFRFDTTNSVLALQYDVRLLSPTRFAAYLGSMADGASYHLAPKVRNDNWARFNDGPTRRITIKIASPSSLQDVVGDGEAASSAIRNMGDAYDAPMIKIEMSMGGKKGGLSEAVKGLANIFFERGSRGEIDLRSITAKRETGDGEPNEDINLLDDLLSVKGSLNLPAKDHDENYQMRSQFLRNAMNDHV